MTTCISSLIVSSFPTHQLRHTSEDYLLTNPYWARERPWGASAHVQSLQPREGLSDFHSLE